MSTLATPLVSWQPRLHAIYLSYMAILNLSLTLLWPPVLDSHLMYTNSYFYGMITVLYTLVGVFERTRQTHMIYIISYFIAWQSYLQIYNHDDLNNIESINTCSHLAMSLFVTVFYNCAFSLTVQVNISCLWSVVRWEETQALWRGRWTGFERGGCWRRIS